MPTLLIELIIINNYFLIFLIVSTIGIFFSYIIYQEQRTARSTRDYQRLYAEVITTYEQGEPLKLTTNRA